MRRRPFLAGLTALGAGCLRAGPRPERLRWHTPIGPDLPSGIVRAAGVVAVPKTFETYGVERDGSVTWKRFDHGGPVRALPDGFLAVGAPNYHPENATNRAVLHRLAAAGPVRWSRPVGPLDGVVGVAAGDARAYVLRATGGDDLLVARALSDGRELWRRPLDAPAAGPRVVDGTVVTVGAETVGRDPVTGETRWRGPATGVRWPPAVAAGRAYLTRATPPTVRAVDGDGRERARYDLPGARATAPLAVAGGVGLARTDAGPVAVAPETGRPRWPAAFDGWTPVSLAGVVGARVTVVDARGRLRAVEESGATAWTATVPGEGVVATTGEGTVYAASERGLYAFDA